MPKQPIPHNPDDPTSIREVDLDSLEDDEFSPFFKPGNDDETSDDETDPNLSVIDGGKPEDDEQPEGDEETYVTLPGGRKIDIDKLETLADFDEFINSNPTAWQAVQRALSTPPILPGTTGPVPGTPTSPSPSPSAGVPGAGGYPTVLPPAPGSTATEDIPEAIKEDPALLALWHRAASSEQQLKDFQEQYQQRVVADRQQQLNSALGIARQQFQTENKLSDEQMERLLWHVADQRIAPAFLASNPNDPVSAIKSAIEVTFYRTPQFRDTLIADADRVRKEEAAKSATRKRKASSLSGGTGTSAPPVGTNVPKAKSQQERIDLLASALGKMRRASE